jgi:hypothetical protein
MLSQLELDELIINKYLPLVAKNHKPFEQYKLEKLPLTSIQESLNVWFQWFEQLTISDITKLLNLVTSVKGIHNVREECLAVTVPENWESIWETFSLPSINFWSKFFQPLITERVKGIHYFQIIIILCSYKINTI